MRVKLKRICTRYCTPCATRCRKLITSSKIGPRMLQWRTSTSLWLDVEEFERALCRGPEEAVDIYAGELLEGRYDEWLLDERERRETDWTYARR
jgi:hypothetical protein